MIVININVDEILFHRSTNILLLALINFDQTAINIDLPPIKLTYGVTS